MEKFTVTEIVTLPNGRVILNGPKGSIEIERKSDERSVARFSPIKRFVFPELRQHHVGVGDLATASTVPGLPTTIF